jgi:hypothetical protein
LIFEFWINQKIDADNRNCDWYAVDSMVEVSLLPFGFIAYMVENLKIWQLTVTLNWNSPPSLP